MRGGLLVDEDPRATNNINTLQSIMNLGISSDPIQRKRDCADGDVEE